MKIGGSTWSFLRESDLAGTFERLAGHGLTRVDLLLTAPHAPALSMTSQEAAAIGAAARRAGVVVEAVDVPFLDQNLASANLEMREFTVAQIKRMIDLANALEAEFSLMLPGRMPPPATNPAARAVYVDWLRAGCDQVARYASGKGVQLLMENHPIAVLADTAEMAAFLGGYDGEIGALYDTANAAVAKEDQACAIETIAPWLRQVHLADATHLRGVHDPIGDGDVDFRVVLSALGKIGFSRTCVLEVVGQNPDTGLSRSLAALADMGWRFDAAATGQSAL